MAAHGSEAAFAGAARTEGLDLSHLDDGVLLRIFQLLSPFDRFSIAGTARRYRDLVKNGRLYLLVAGSDSRAWRQHRHVYDTLQAAVDDSRPGETIVLERGAVHDAGDVVIRHPLHLVGSGSTPADTMLRCAPGAAAALDFRSSGKLANLTILAARAACLHHARGSVWVEQCDLQCEAPRGLEHLFSPLVTSATSPPKRRLGSVLQPTPLADLEQPGAISIIETTIQGGRTVIQTLGSGALRNVRCLYQQRVYFWFDVDSRHGDGTANKRRGHSSILAAGPPLVVPQKVGKRKAEEAGILDEAEAEELLDLRAEAWSASGLKLSA